MSSINVNTVAAGGGGRGGGGAPSGCNFLSCLINFDEERADRLTTMPHTCSKFAINAVDSRKCVSFWGSAPEANAFSLRFRLLAVGGFI